MTTDEIKAGLRMRLTKQEWYWEMTGQPQTMPSLNNLLTAALAALDRVPEWRPIATAPRDGTEVLLLVKFRAGIRHRMLVGHYMEGGFCIEDHPAIDEGWYFWNGCMFDKASKPLRWMPLPIPPAPEVPDAGR